ncbi:MAG: lipocalin-like domain-containing protein [Bryobacteraceae bacterium]
MKIPSILLLTAMAWLAAPAPAAAQNDAPSIRDPFIGVWKLVSYERKYSDGRVAYPYGKNATGRITYDRAGRMSAQLMNPDRPKSSLSTQGIRGASAEDLRSVMTGFIAYYGTFDVDGANKTVIHHVQSCLLPGWVGTDLKRGYAFSGKRLTLTVANADGAGVLVWEREPE